MVRKPGFQSGNTGSIPVGGIGCRFNLSNSKMYRRKDYSTALELRQQGKTYGEIRSVLSIPKSTQSFWFKNLDLPSRAKSILAAKQGNGLKALGIFNRERTIAIQAENENTRKSFEMRVSSVSRRELMLIGAVLYWAEGYKNFNSKRKDYPYVGFANSDPQMVKVFIRFLEDVLRISRIRGEIHIQPNLSAEDSIKYWHAVTKIPRENLRAYKAVSRASGGKRPKHLLPYGTLQLKVQNRKEFFKIRGLIDGILKSLLAT